MGDQVKNVIVGNKLVFLGVYGKYHIQDRPISLAWLSMIIILIMMVLLT
jgi:hypothetical protein